MHTAPQLIKSCGAKQALPRCTHVPSLVSLAQSFLKPEDPMSKKFSASGACSLHHTGTATTKAHRLWLYTCTQQVSHQGCPPFGLWGREKVNRCKKLARALHVHTAPQLIKSYGAKWALPRCTHVPSLVSLAQSFLEPKDPKPKKFSSPGACSMHPTPPATTKAHTLGWYTCDLQVWVWWCPAFDL